MTLLFLFSVCSSEQALLASLPDSSLSESSSWQSDILPTTDATRSRLNTPHVPSTASGGWLAGANSVGEWVQADLLALTHVYKLATQGRHHDTSQQWTSSLQLKTSLTNVEQNFEFVQATPGGAAVTFNANYDEDSIVENRFSPRVARYVRLYPQTWNLHMALRWEVYGCAFEYGVTCPAISLVNSDVSSDVALAGSEVEVRCVSGFSFGSTHDADVITSRCLFGQWDVDLTPYTCSGKLCSHLM